MQNSGGENFFKFVHLTVTDLSRFLHRMNVEQIVQFALLFVLCVQGDCLIALGRRQGLLAFSDMSMHPLLVAERLRCGAVYLHFSVKEKGYECSLFMLIVIGRTVFTMMYHFIKKINVTVV